MKMSVIVLGGLAFSYLLRHRSAALRHWVLAVALACAATVPLLQLVVPVWRLPIGAPAPFESYTESSSQSTPASSAAGPTTVRSDAGRRASPSSSPAVPLNWDRVLTSIWLAGSVVSLLILLVGMLRLTWLAAHARRVTGGPWRDLANQIALAYDLRRPVVLLETAHPSLLVTWGLARPKVILPEASRNWSEERARVVLTHELAHIGRGDWVVQISAELLRAVYWFNPLLWIACRRLRLDSEHACDDEVMKRGVEPSDYASHLVDLARALGVRRRTWVPAPAMARPSSLERRVRAMLNDRLNRTPMTRATRAAAFAILLILTIGVAAAQSGFVSLTGTVVDEHGRGIPGATLVLANEPRQMKYEVKSNDAGRFEFVGLPAGEYAFAARGLGFQTFEDNIAVAGQNLQRHVALKLGRLQETINVDFNPTDAGSSDERAPAAVVKEVPMPARKECVPSSSGGRIVPPRKIRDVWPIYPVALRGTGTEGTVVLEGRIGVDGYVGDIHVVGDAHPELAQSAITAVRQWRFTETLLNCTPAEPLMMITTTFKAMPPAPPPAPPRGR
jgi:beta-lactamase regulating signal transducer with metallopeptidase domain